MFKLSPSQMAACLARDLPDNCRILLGSGLPQQLAAVTDPQRNITLTGCDQLSAEPGSFDFSILSAREISAAGDIVLQDADRHAAEQLLAADHLLVLAELFNDSGSPLLSATCTLPADRTNAVSSFYSDIAVFDFSNGKVFIRELIEGITLGTLQMETDAELNIAPNLGLLRVPASAKTTEK